MNLEALHKISYGLYVITSRRGEDFNGQICNTVFQVTSKPPKIAVSINQQNLTHEFIRKSRVFAVSILSEKTPLEFIGHFGFKCGRDVDKFRTIGYKEGKTGSPIVTDHAVAYLEAEVINEMDVGTHTIFVGQIVDAEILTDEKPITYDSYHTIKRGVTPKTAPTYIKKEEESEKIEKYRCTVCGYIYDPEIGDAESGIDPGTPFQELPDDWVCPLCGATKDQFEKVE